MKEKTAEQISRDNLVIGYFLDNPTATIKQISNVTGESSSTIQRILNAPEHVGILISKTDRTIKDQLLHNKLMGNSKGGRTTFESYDAVKDQEGKFVGLSETQTSGKEAAKENQVVEIALIFSKNPHLTIDELADLLDGDISRDLVYDCLTDSRIFEIFGSIFANSIRDRLEQNLYSILKKLPINFDIEMLAEIDLTDREKDVISRRLGYGKGLVSMDLVAADLEISRAMVLKIENRAINKIQKYFSEKEIKLSK